MSFEVGVSERHAVVFSFDRFWGGLSIAVDGVDVVRTVRFGSLSLVKSWDVVVGVQERHLVHIEKHREALFPAFRPQPVYAYVDGLPVAQGVA